MATRTLNVEIIGASGLKDTELIGKSDPYVVVSVGKTERKSKPAKDQAETPAWNETFSLPVLDTDTELLVRILNDDTMGRDEEMGHAVVPLSLIHGGSHSASTFPLELKGKPHGEIKMSLSFEGEGHQAHRETESHGLAEKVQGLFVGDKKDHDGEGHEHHGGGHPEGHHEGEGIKEKLEDKIEGLKEKKHRKKAKKHRGSGDEGGSSSSSESEKEDD
jgi:Ca2+-dependent lipid-binding protein